MAESQSYLQLHNMCSKTSCASAYNIFYTFFAFITWKKEKLNKITQKLALPIHIQIKSVSFSG
jgi:hypothetical protein